MDDIDMRLMSAVQQELPLCHEPFSDVAKYLGIGVDEVIARLQKLRETGYIKRIGGIFNSKQLGYCGTLCGMHVPEQRIEEISEILNAYSGITHNYLRDDDKFNMWFTVQALGYDELDRLLQEIIAETGISECISLPSMESYKIQVKFEVDGAGSPGGNNDNI